MPPSRANQALHAAPRHSLRMLGYPRSLRSLGAPERDRQIRRPRVPALSRGIMASCETNSRQLFSATASGSSRIAPKCQARMERVAQRQRREKASPQQSPSSYETVALMHCAACQGALLARR